MRAATMAAAFGIAAFAVPVAMAQNCPYNSTQGTCACPTSGAGGSVTCFGGQLFRSTDNSCQPDTRPGSNNTQLFACASTSFVCNTAAFPCGGCTAATSTQGGACSSPIGGQYTNQCGACGCPSGTQLCSASNTCAAVIACAPGTTFDPCTGACSSPNILKDQASPQSAYINITGNIFSTAGDLAINGMSTFGSAARVLSGAQNLLYGNIDTTSTGSLMLLQNENADRFRVDAAGNVTGAGSFSLGRLAADPSGIGGRMYFRTSDNTFRCHNGTAWAACGASGLPAGSINQTLRHDGAAWVTSGLLRNDGTSVTISSSIAGTNDVVNVLTLGRGGSGAEVTGFGQSMDFNAGGTTVAQVAGQLMTSGGFGGSMAFSTKDPSGSMTERLRIGNLNGATTQPSVAISNAWIQSIYSLDVRNFAAASTAIVNVANENAARVWTGFRIARGAPSTERWMLGMNNANENFRIRRNSATDDLVVDAATGKVTVASLQVTGGTAPLTGKVLTADVNGNATWENPGAISSCAASRTFVGMTTAGPYDGNRGGYKAADALCNAFNAGSTVCTAEEILNSYKCSTGSDAISTATGSGWINQGPPGFTAYSNDCDGWTSNAAGYFGRLWTFNWTTGGKATVRECGVAPLQFACCE